MLKAHVRRAELHEWIRLGYLGILSFSFVLYMIPFIGPSTMAIAGSIAAIGKELNPLVIGICISAGSSIAKTLHYYIAHFAKGALGKNSRGRLEEYGYRLGKWKCVASFVAAATPIPDEPVVIALALMRYSPLKFLASFFLGKIVVTIPGAYIGTYAGHLLTRYVGNVATVIGSIVFTVILTILLVKIDFRKLVQRPKHVQSEPIKDSTKDT